MINEYTAARNVLPDRVVGFAEILGHEFSLLFLLFFNFNKRLQLQTFLLIKASKFSMTLALQSLPREIFIDIYIYSSFYFNSDIPGQNGFNNSCS